MLFHTKKERKIVSLYHNNELIYQGVWNNIPIKEQVLINKSINFYNDDDPCYLHRTAIRIRLTSELEQLFKEFKHNNVNSCSINDYPDFFYLLQEYTELQNINYVSLSEE